MGPADGRLYSMGYNNYQQLGVGADDKVQRNTPTLILGDLSSLSIADVAAGQRHAAAVSQSGRVYTWGWGWYKPLGLGATDQVDRGTPTLVEWDLSSISADQVAASDWNVYALAQGKSPSPVRGPAAASIVSGHTVHDSNVCYCRRTAVIHHVQVPVFPPVVAFTIQVWQSDTAVICRSSLCLGLRW